MKVCISDDNADNIDYGDDIARCTDIFIHQMKVHQFIFIIISNIYISIFHYACFLFAFSNYNDFYAFVSLYLFIFYLF